MKIIITAPSLNIQNNISGISAVTNFIVSASKEHVYQHFEVGKTDIEKRNFLWVSKNVKMYCKWIVVLATTNNALIHFNCPIDTLSLIRDSPMLLIAKLLAKRMIIHIHGGEFLLSRNIPVILKLLMRFNLGGKCPKVVLSELEQKALETNIKGIRTHILPNCINTEVASTFERNVGALDIPTLLFIGRISKDKGLETIYLALEALHKAGLQFKFIMAGKGPDQVIYTSKFEALLKAKFQYKGVVYGAEKDQIFKNCNIFLLPSLYEGLPIALIEAMSFGLVPIVTDVGSIKSMVKQHESGIILEIHTPLALISAIKSLADDRQLMKRLCAAARVIALNHCNRELYMNKLEEIYHYE